MVNSLKIFGIGAAVGTLGILALLLIALLSIGESGFALMVLLLIGVFVVGGAIALVLRSGRYIF